MATGQHHYDTAEGLLYDAGEAEQGGMLERYCLAAAGVHATLALAAATAATVAAPNAERASNGERGGR